MEERTWEIVGKCVARFPVPGGWLYRDPTRPESGAMTFVPASYPAKSFPDPDRSPSGAALDFDVEIALVDTQAFRAPPTQGYENGCHVTGTRYVYIDAQYSAPEPEYDVDPAWQDIIRNDRQGRALQASGLGLSDWVPGVDRDRAIRRLYRQNTFKGRCVGAIAVGFIIEVFDLSHAGRTAGRTIVVEVPSKAFTIVPRQPGGVGAP